MTRSTRALVTIAAVFAVVAFTMALAAIWADEGRWFVTAGLLILAAGLLSIVGMVLPVVRSMRYWEDERATPHPRPTAAEHAAYRAALAEFNRKRKDGEHADAYHAALAEFERKREDGEHPPN